MECLDSQFASCATATPAIGLHPRLAVHSRQWERFVELLICASVVAGVVYSLNFRHGALHPLAVAATHHRWAALALKPSLIWFSMAMVLLSLRTLLWFRYRAFPPADHQNAPRLTVIIPAYNEGAMVARTIESCATCNYPRDRLEIIVVDDGSKDDTWDHIESAARPYPGVVRPIRFASNQGKRAALCAGFEKASGELVVTVDSDSVIESDTLLAIAGPFRDPKIGAVGGKVAVFNRFAGFLPRMLHVRYVLSFDFLRRAQSTYGTVYCCPGALSAYRLDVVKKVLPKWRNQTFLGARCTFGEDRALTNDILALGYDAVYQSTAVVHTVVPQTYSKLCRMYLRWDRSYVREELRLARIVWSRRPVSLLLTVLEKTLTNLRYPISYITLAIVVALSVETPWVFVRMMIAVGVASAFSMLYFLRGERSWEFVYGIAYSYFALFTLFWIFPCAIMTVRSRSWLTR